jgi:hypothetical protein
VLAVPASSQCYEAPDRLVTEVPTFLRWLEGIPHMI